MAGGARAKSKAPLPGQKSISSFFGAAATAKPKPKPKPSGGSSKATSSPATGSAAAAAAVERTAAVAVPDTPDTAPCSPETPALGASMKKKEGACTLGNKDGLGRTAPSTDATIRSTPPGSDLRDSDDDDDDDTMQTPANKTVVKRLGSGRGSAKRPVIEDSDDTEDDDDHASSSMENGGESSCIINNNARTPEEYTRSPLKFINRRVAKVFENDNNGELEIFLGTVTRYTSAADAQANEPLWRVYYDDDDEEDFYWEDLDKGISLYQRKGHRLEPKASAGSITSKRKIINDSEDEDDDDEDDTDDDAYKPADGDDDEDDDDDDMEDLVDSDLDGAAAASKKPARKRVKTASSPSKSESTEKIATANTTISLPSASGSASSQSAVKRKPEEESAAASSSSVSKKAKPAASNSKPKAKKSAAAGWSFLKKQTTAEIKAGSRKKSTGGHGGKSSNVILVGGASDGDKPIRAYEPENPDLEIISNPQEMFNDMVFKQLTDDGNNVAVLDPLLKVMAGRPLRVATMCSGTESPVLALDMLSNSIEEFYLKHRRDNVDLPSGTEGQRVFQVEHVFSCEIEPFKQAYIERNFAPPLLFRDIRELGNDRAATAYGTLAPVPNSPGSVDILVAGTSCVDFSNLNNSQKDLDEKGESGQTFRGMLDWVKKAKPAVVILENVSGAPFDKMVSLMESCGYYSSFVRVDSKKYYIPHTRQRGYVVAVKKGKNISSGIAARWKAQVKALEREASGALDEFMLPGDDPAVMKGRASLVSNGSAGASKTDWVKCESRHLLARSKESLGEKRPFTGWSESNPTSMPGYTWNDWANAQVHRIHDLIDINTLRLAKQGVDCTYKTMVSSFFIISLSLIAHANQAFSNILLPLFRFGMFPRT